MWPGCAAAVQPGITSHWTRIRGFLALKQTDPHPEFGNDVSCGALQIEEDTDRDRYMSPLEAKRYGIIDHVIGGDDAGFQVTVRVTR